MLHPHSAIAASNERSGRYLQRPPRESVDATWLHRFAFSNSSSSNPPNPVSLARGTAPRQQASPAKPPGRPHRLLLPRPIRPSLPRPSLSKVSSHDVRTSADPKCLLKNPKILGCRFSCTGYRLKRPRYATPPDGCAFDNLWVDAKAQGFRYRGIGGAVGTAVCPPPRAQIPAGGITAPGSCLGSNAQKRTSERVPSDALDRPYAALCPSGLFCRRHLSLAKHLPSIPDLAVANA
jgi:hypothetical protein